ncbi:MAG: ABC-F family ATP-binding cassette domain-containing protein [Spirochaetes bacterium]|nr:ABC-F family ATP-binding cassette domain-containing protein [Spirochaetota bacterium]MBU0956876.1 ABC-F family ATP-binding cassette domain-containing protein [Spirochaetota bacterium]
MALIKTNNLTRDFGGELILRGVNISLEAGRKYGLVGRNGCGKTTLVRILAGLDDDFRGGLKREGKQKIALVEQKAPDFGEAETSVDFLVRDISALGEQLDELAVQMGDPDPAICQRAMRDYAILREQYDLLDGDHAADNAERLLKRIGLGERAWTAAESLSGGEKNLLALARALLSRPDLLILDEPGNHLDAGGLAWLEEFLAGLPCCVLMVSHDRRLLDRVADTILEMDGGVITEWKGNYSQYRLERLRSAAAQGRSWQADKKRVERLEALVRRFADIARARPDPAWGKRLRARRSQLERVKAEATERPDIGNLDARVVFDGEKSRADLAVAISAYSKRYDDVVIIEDSGFTILNGERVALVGPNGSGKTSLIRDLVARGSWDDPCLRVGPSMRVGYCAQQQEVFNHDDSIEDAFLKLLTDKKEVLHHLGRFLFTYTDLPRIIGSLSGGELNRLQLARASALKANFLILDEPTNHLDIPTREAVEEALLEFEGTVLLVSHDRYFLDKLVDRVVFIEQRKFVEYEGSFSEYWRDIGAPAVQAARDGGLQERSRAIGDSQGGRGRDSGTAAAAAGRKQGRGAKAGQTGTDDTKQGQAELEQRISAMERTKEDMERQIATAFGKRDYTRARDLTAELERHNRLLNQLWKQL